MHRMGLNDTGFLSPETAAWIAKHRREAPQAFRIADDLNRAGVKALYASPPRDDKQQLLVALLFARLLELYQSTLVLTERGSISAARSLLRVMCEASFYIRACAKDAAFIDEYVQDDRIRQKQLIDALTAIPPEANAVAAEILEDLKRQAAELRSQIKADKQGALKAIDTAERADLLDFYRLFFVPYSNSVHSAVRDLNTHVVENAKGDIASLKWGPDSERVETTVDAAVQIFFVAVHALLQVFPRPELETEFERLWSEHKARIEAQSEKRKEGIKDNGAPSPAA